VQMADEIRYKAIVSASDLNIVEESWNRQRTWKLNHTKGRKS